MKRAYRFRWGYINQYGLYEKFAFGFVVLGLLVYKPKALVWYRYEVDREVYDMGAKGLTNIFYDEAVKKLFQSVPYDFGFSAISTSEEFDIDRDVLRYLMEGIAVPNQR